MGLQKAGHEWVTFTSLGTFGLSWWFSGRESACNADVDLIPGLGRSPGEENGNPLQYSCLENSTRETWWAIVHGATKELDTTEQPPPTAMCKLGTFESQNWICRPLLPSLFLHFHPPGQLWQITHFLLFFISELLCILLPWPGVPFLISSFPHTCDCYIVLYFRFKLTSFVLFIVLPLLMYHIYHICYSITFPVKLWHLFTCIFPPVLP